MVKICQTGLLKLNFETRPKKRISGFCKKFPQAMDEVENFFYQFPNPWALRVSGMGGYTSKCEKSQNHCTLLGKCYRRTLRFVCKKMEKTVSQVWAQVVL